MPRKTAARNSREKSKLIAFCELYIDILSDPIQGLNEISQARVTGKIEAMKMVLKQLGVNGAKETPDAE